MSYSGATSISFIVYICSTWESSCGDRIHRELHSLVYRAPTLLQVLYCLAWLIIYGHILVHWTNRDRWFFVYCQAEIKQMYSVETLHTGSWESVTKFLVCVSEQWMQHQACERNSHDGVVGKRDVALIQCSYHDGGSGEGALRLGRERRAALNQNWYHDGPQHFVYESVYSGW